jgi:hypothetical protein
MSMLMGKTVLELLGVFVAVEEAVVVVLSVEVAAVVVVATPMMWMNKMENPHLMPTLLIP